VHLDISNTLHKVAVDFILLFNTDIPLFDILEKSK